MQLRLDKLDPNSNEVLTSIAAGLLPLHEFGGIIPEKSMRTSVKFAGEARGCFGAAIVENAATEVLSGVKAPPFNFTGKWVVGVKAWREQKLAELRRVLPLKGPWTNDPTYGCKQNSTHVEDFMVFHDCLSQWWEKEAQEYMKMCRALDAHNFADLKLSMCYHTSRSSRYARKDPRRFGMGVPHAVWSTDCVHKPRASQRIETLVGRPCHPDCAEALRMLTTPGARTEMYLLAAELGFLRALIVTKFGTEELAVIQLPDDADTDMPMQLLQAELGVQGVLELKHVQLQPGPY
ncbi:hypothetical protein B484DRAFT_404029 [Ochromonadaceae sp. CCMP2298]|nr:hypothetical protein B484DRAFT_404029 [Ochromonadaceae sp. CCMP2298]